MLPSSNTLGNLNSKATPEDLQHQRGVTVSNGHHITKTERNTKRANENEEARRQYTLRSMYWKDLKANLP